MTVKRGGVMVEAADARQAEARRVELGPRLWQHVVGLGRLDGEEVPAARQLEHEVHVRLVLVER